MAMVGVDG